MKGSLKRYLDREGKGGTLRIMPGIGNNNPMGSDGQVLGLYHHSIV